MSALNTIKNNRILIVDDNRAIHSDFRKILCPSQGSELEGVEARLFETEVAAPRPTYEIDSVYQGQEALALVESARKARCPYAMAFMDVRMPPGWDGVETTSRIWQVCPDIQIVLCTAYSDYSWDEMIGKLGHSDRLVILKKPFDPVEVMQLTAALTEKYRLAREARSRMEQLESTVAQRTKVLAKTNEHLQTQIFERQKATQALRESEDRYLMLFRENPSPMWVVDSKTLLFLAVNPAAVQCYGYSEQELLGMTLKDLHLPEDSPMLAERFSDTHPPQLPTASFVSRQRKKDGRFITVEIRSRSITFAGRKAKLALANDITERQYAEDRIREQAALLNLASDAILVKDLSGRIQFWNKGAERLYGWNSEKAVGSHMKDLFPNDDSAGLQVVENELLSQGEWNGELRRFTQDGQQVIVNSRWTLLRDRIGKPRSVLIIDSDITERKKLETQFLRAQRIEGIGTLATGMAHDLNNILAPILISAGTLRWGLSKEEQEKAINRIEVSVKRGAGIIQQVLTFGRGLNGERIAINAGEVVDEVVRIAGRTFPKDVIITSQVDAGLWTIMGDRTQIHQVLLNLCVNARDAMPTGGKLSVRIRNITLAEARPALPAPARPGHYVMLQISDSGCGISTEDRERIFDPFFTTKEIGKGTGLGLSTVLGIIKSHHGGVMVESEIGKGTTFRILIPASPEEAKNLEPYQAPELPRGEGEAVLIVDDEPEVIAGITTLLEQRNYRVLVAKNGVEALAVIQRHRSGIDALVTDIMMPEMDGVQLIRVLRKIHPRLQIIASSGLGTEIGGSMRAQELEALNVKMFLAKPYSADKLLEGLQRLLRNGRPVAAALAPVVPVASIISACPVVR